MIKPSAIVVFPEVDSLFDVIEPLDGQSLEQETENLMSLSLRHYNSEFIELMTAANVLWVIMASTVLLYIMHNAMKYLVRQGRYKEFHITFFYLLAHLTLTTRILQFAITVAYYHGFGRHSMTRQISALCVLSSIFEGMLGL